MWFLIALITAIVGIGGLLVAIFSSGEARGGAIVTTALAVIIFLGATFGFSITIVPQGYVYSARVFGETMEDRSWDEGFHLVPPWYSMVRYDTRRQQLDLTGEDTANGVASGGVSLEVFDITFPYSIRPELTWKIAREIGNERRLRDMLWGAARSAARDTLANYTWEQITFTDRDAVTVYVTDRFRTLLEADLVASGFTEEESSNVFTVSNALIRNVQPPLRIRAENDERAASEVMLERQEIETEIARVVAERRANEGLGISRLWDELPNASPSEIATVINAIANKQRADAMLRAVESGSVDVIVMQDQTASVALPAN